MQQVRMMVALVPLAQVSALGERWAWGVLSPEEQVRADRLARAGSRREFIVAHGLKRLMLADVTGADPSSLRFGPRDAFGKPAVLGEGGVDFNLSHTAGAVACAVVVGAGQGVGLDLEAVDRRVSLDLADRFFAGDETAWIRRQAHPERAFLAVWTLKEAFVKAAGRGLALGLTSFSVRPPEREADGDTPQDAQLLRQQGDACLPHPMRLWQWRSASGHWVGAGVTGPNPEGVTVTARTGWPGLTL